MSVSVLMSVYQNEKPEWLDQALKSVWTSQTKKPSEIILVKDGLLTDALDTVIERWQSKIGNILIVLNNSVNLGLTKSLNIGLNVVTSEYIARMDSDDIAHPMRLEWQEKFLEEHTDIAVVGGRIQEFNEEMECLGIRSFPLTSDEIRAYIGKASPFAHPAVMIRSSLFKNGLKYNENYKTSQDIALWFDILIAGYKMANLDKVVLYFRRNDSVFKRRSKNKAVNEFKIYINGIYRLEGIVSLKYLYPLARLCFRLMPIGMIKWIYGSKLRNYILQ